MFATFGGHNCIDFNSNARLITFKISKRCLDVFYVLHACFSFCKNANVPWEILGRTFNVATHLCNFCLNKMLRAALHRNSNNLSKTTEVTSMCGKRNRYLLVPHDSID